MFPSPGIQSHVYNSDTDKHQTNTAIHQLQEMPVGYARYLHYQPYFYDYALCNNKAGVSFFPDKHVNIKQQWIKSYCGKQEQSRDKEIAENRIA